MGARNDVHCVSIEHKLGIKASPTAVLQYGDHGGATGFLVGQENRGLEYMFIMMNAARYAVGVQGIAVADRAYQKAVHYARVRVQSRPVDGSIKASAPIIHHPDVRRMLMTMRAYTEGCRAMASVAAAAYDAAHHHTDADTRKQNNAVYEYMVPLVKGFSTEMSLEVTSLGVQVHGGMGFIEETGAAQHMRDARILAIYEGTNGIQAADLVGRKLQIDQGATIQSLINDLRSEASDQNLIALITACETVAARLVTADHDDRMAASYPFLTMLATATCGWLMERQARAAGTMQGDPVFAATKQAVVRFYLTQIVPEALGVMAAAMAPAEVLYAVDAANL